MRRYLFVDDNLEFAENLVEIAGDCGCDCEMAACGAEAMERVAGTRFDAVVTDMRMPGMGGAELVHEIRRVDPGLPAVVLTAHAGGRRPGGGASRGAARGARQAGAHRPAPGPARRGPPRRAAGGPRGRPGPARQPHRGPAAARLRRGHRLHRPGHRPARAGAPLRRAGRPAPARRPGRRGRPPPHGAVPRDPPRRRDRLPGRRPEGAHATFGKPFDTAALLDAVERLHAGRTSSP